MKVLMISSIPVFPTDAGNRSRILSLSRAIRQQGHDLWFLNLPGDLNAAGDAGAHRREFGSDRYLKAPQEHPIPHFLRTLPRKLRRRMTRWIRWPGCFYDRLDSYHRRAWTDQILALQRQYGFDAVVVEYVIHSAVFDHLPPGVHRVLDTHDSFADRHRLYVANGVYRYFLSLRPKDELRGFRRADAVLAIQNAEAQDFCARLAAQGGGPDLHVVNHFLDLAAAPTCQSGAPHAIFLGAANMHNVNAIGTFIAHVLPQVLERVPEFRICLFGPICTQIEDQAAVIRRGPVEHLSEAFAAGSLMINPMLSGTGISIKLLDAMAAGMPVVSTRTGARGLPDTYFDSVEVVVDDDYRGFADRIVALMQDAPRRREMGRIARENALRWNGEQHAALRRALTGQAGETGRSLR